MCDPVDFLSLIIATVRIFTGVLVAARRFVVVMQMEYDFLILFLVVFVSLVAVVLVHTHNLVTLAYNLLESPLSSVAEWVGREGNTSPTLNSSRFRDLRMTFTLRDGENTMCVFGRVSGYRTDSLGELAGD